MGILKVSKPKLEKIPEGEIEQIKKKVYTEDSRVKIITEWKLAQ